MSEKRQPGYYRVKYLGVWYLGFYIGNLSYPWELKASDGDIMRHQDSAFDEIIDTPIPPEPKVEVTDNEIEKSFWDNGGRGYMSLRGFTKAVRDFLTKTK
jgi:hypothetical protein